MHSITFGVDAGDHVIITIIGRPDENDDWLDATIDVAAGAFSGCVSASLVTVDFPRFRREFDSLHQTLDGTATLETIERQLRFECVGHADTTGDGLGPMPVSLSALGVANGLSARDAATHDVRRMGQTRVSG